MTSSEPYVRPYNRIVFVAMLVSVFSFLLLETIALRKLVRIVAPSSIVCCNITDGAEEIYGSNRKRLLLLEKGSSRIRFYEALNRGMNGERKQGDCKMYAEMAVSLHELL